MEFSEYVESKGNNVNIVNYNYHWQTAKGLLVKRWDNVEHHRRIRTFPHHLHLPDEQVVESGPITLQQVLSEIEYNI